MTTNPSIEVLTCSECGTGHYYRHMFVWQCDSCEHAITLRDIDLDAGETIAVSADGALGFITND